MKWLKELFCRKEDSDSPAAIPKEILDAEKEIESIFLDCSFNQNEVYSLYLTALKTMEDNNFKRFLNEILPKLKEEVNNGSSHCQTSKVTRAVFDKEYCLNNIQLCALRRKGISVYGNSDSYTNLKSESTYWYEVYLIKV